MAPWSDLPSILADPDGKAALYGYLKSIEPGRQRYIELLDEIALFKQQTDDAQRRADRIVTSYVRGTDSTLGGLAASAPSEKQVQDLRQSAGAAGGLFGTMEAAAKEELRRVVPQFLKDVEKGEKSVRARVRESGYREFAEKLAGEKRQREGGENNNSCALC